MSTLTLLSVAVALLLFCSFHYWLRAWYVTAPIVAVVVGWGLGPSGLNWIPLNMDATGHATIALFEITLIVVLFADASQLRIRGNGAVPIPTLRLLAVGIPLAVLFGGVIGWPLLPELRAWELAMLGAILAATDSALGSAVMEHPQIPEQERTILQAESGLNDGVVLPLVLFLAICDSVFSGIQYLGHWVTFTLSQFGFGVGIGLAVGYFGRYLVRWSQPQENINALITQFGGLGIALLAYALATWIHGNGFLAAFSAGFAFANFGRPIAKSSTAASEAQGRLMALVTFFFFGLFFLEPIWKEATWQTVLYAFLSLTVVRIATVWVSLWRADSSPKQKWLLSAMGPKGIASLLFAMLVVVKFPIQNIREIFVTVGVTVSLSILLHGVIALPVARWYSRSCQHNS